MIMLDRWSNIFDYIKQRKFVTIKEIMDNFNISLSTARRDLIAMEEKKLIKRTRGGAEALHIEAEALGTVEGALMENSEEKKKIARKAASLIKDEDFIFIDSGTTCYYIIDYITAKNVTVVTNGILQIQKLMEKGIKTYVLGGYAQPENNLIIGEDMEKKVSMMNFNIAFLGTLGVDPVGGFKAYALFDANFKSKVMKAAEKTYVLADKSKFNIRKFYTYASIEEATVITTGEVDIKDERLKTIYG